MKIILTLVLLFSFLFFSCQDNLLEPEKTLTPDAVLVPGPGDDVPPPPPPPNLCQIDDPALQEFIDEVAEILPLDLGEYLIDGEPLSCKMLNCLEESKNHGQFVSCMAHLTNFLKKEGYISGKEKGKIMKAAAKSDVGK